LKKEHIIVYSFQSLEDPLMKGLMLEYLKQTDPQLNLHFHLITHEQTYFSLEKNEKIKQKYQLHSKYNISWHPVTYHSGKFILLKKTFDFLKTAMICLRLKREFRIKTIVGFLPIAGGYSAILSRLLRMKLVIYCFEPHSEYLADFGTWERSSVKFRLLNYFEKFQVRHSDYLVVPTTHSELLVKKINTKGKIFVCPISVDTNLMRMNEEKRTEIRNKLNCGDKTVLIYTGKFNGIYYPVSVIRSFFEKLNSAGNNFFLFIISPDYEQVKKEFEGNVFRNSVAVIPPVPYEELSYYISAADLGIVAVPPYPSQKYRTPVKTGIYLSCGLPYIVNRGIAEDDLVAEREKVGVVTDNFSENIPETKYNIIQLLNENKAGLRARCRMVAEKTRDTKIASGILNEIFSDIYGHRI